VATGLETDHRGRDKRATLLGVKPPRSRLPAGISAVIPVHRSEAILPLLIPRLSAALALLGSYEIILVDDGSPDGSWAVIAAAAEEDGRVRGIRLMRNFGQHNALLVGIRQARYAYTVTLDDDLQNPPEEIAHLVERLTDDVDVVYGSPRSEQHSLWRSAASQITKYALEEAMGATAARSVSAFRVFRTDLRHAFERYQSPDISIDVLLTWATTRFAMVRVTHEPRAQGRSNYTFGRLMHHALNMMTGFTTRPLRLASLMGFVFTLFGVAIFIWVVARSIVQGNAVPGFPFLASIIAIFSGVQLLILGIMGEYLARMHLRLLERPSYVVAETTSTNDSTDS
jgi:glycosyltransferase involved in cell wall biosynthesis